MILLSGLMDFAETKKDGLTQKDLDDRFRQVSTVYSDEKLADLKEKISQIGTTEKFKTKDNGITVSEKA